MADNSKAIDAPRALSYNEQGENQMEKTEMTRAEMEAKMRAMAKDNPKVAAMLDGADMEKMSDAEMSAMLEKMSADESEGKSLDTFIAFGSAVKALDGGKLGGHLVVFTKPGDYDLTQERFDSDTDFGEAAKLPILYHHGLDATLKRRRIGTAQITRDDVGLWVEAQLNLRDEYEKQIYALAQAGKMSWSSGSALHAIERVPEAKGARIAQWYIAEASLTPTPAEPRANVYSIKSLVAPQAEPGGAATTASAQAQRANDTNNQNNSEVKMADEIKTLVDAQAAQLKTAAEQVAAQGEQIKGLTASVERVVKALESESPNRASTKVTRAEEDNKFASLAEQCLAVKAFKMSSGEQMDPRLKRLAETKAASGATVGVSSEGGFLVEPTLTTEILKPIHEGGAFSSRARRLPVGANSNYGWINGIDETDRATGSRWGGIRGYRIAEGNAPTSSKPKFRRINWELKKYAVLVYGTDELLADAAQFSEVVRVAAAEELAFMVNDDILNGDGAAGCFGILSSAAAVSVTRTTTGRVVYEDLIGMWARCDTRAKQNAGWFINTDVNPDLDTLAHAVGTGALEPKFVGYDQNGLMRIKGKPVIETEFNASLGTVGDIVLADMSQYLTWEKGGVQAAESLHVLFTTDETTFRFIYRIDGQPAIASPLTPYKGTGNTISPFVKLAT
jgi:HK97 family phage major capsid protein